jgi:TPR repeat protein
MYDIGVSPAISRDEDQGQACVLFDKAVPGYGRAEAFKAVHYLRGNNLPIRWPNGCVSPAQDQVMAIAWYTKAVQDGFWPAAASLGQFYEGWEKGRGVLNPLFGNAEGVHQSFDGAIWWYHIRVIFEPPTADEQGMAETRQRLLADLC